MFSAAFCPKSVATLQLSDGHFRRLHSLCDRKTCFRSSCPRLVSVNESRVYRTVNPLNDVLSAIVGTTIGERIGAEMSATVLTDC